MQSKCAQNMREWEQKMNERNELRAHNEQYDKIFLWLRSVQVFKWNLISACAENERNRDGYTDSFQVFVISILWVCSEPNIAVICI